MQRKFTRDEVCAGIWALFQQHQDDVPETPPCALHEIFDFGYNAKFAERLETFVFSRQRCDDGQAELTIPMGGSFWQLTYSTFNGESVSAVATVNTHYCTKVSRPDVPPIRIWAYADAPTCYRVSDNGGDEDWVAVVPLEYSDRLHAMAFLGAPTFGACDVATYTVGDEMVIVGCHA
jgi:hypothetical protein